MHFKSYYVHTAQVTIAKLDASNSKIVFKIEPISFTTSPIVFYLYSWKSFWKASCGDFRRHYYIINK